MSAAPAGVDVRAGSSLGRLLELGSEGDVWLNDVAWLHMRLMKGLRGATSAWWSLAGLLVTTFAFLGVNMFLSGLHSYGQL